MSDIATLSLDGVIGTIKLANAPRRNCINLQLANCLQSLVAEATAGGCLTIILEALGPIFSAGIDLKAPPAENRQATPILHSLVQESRIPWIAKIRGGVIGMGVSLVANCHVSVAADNSWWWLPEIEVMKRMPWGVMENLGSMANPAAIMGAIATCERLSARDAFAAGLVSMVAAQSELDRVVAKAAANLSSIGDEARKELVDWWNAKR